MLSLHEEYNRLEKLTYKKDQIIQLLFLYNFLLKRKEEKLYFNFLKEITPKYSATKLEQLIKCITHKTPYQVLLNSNIPVQVMNEIRRYLEDAITTNYKVNEKYISIAKEMIRKKYSSNLIYQFRRFIKCKKKISLNDAIYLFEFINKYNLTNWYFLANIHNLYLENENLTDILTKYKESKNDQERTYLLIEYQEQVNILLKQ